MKNNKLYTGTIIGWVLVVILEVLGSLSDSHTIRKAKLPARVLYFFLRYGRRTLLFTIAVTNLLLLSQKINRN